MDEAGFIALMREAIWTGAVLAWPVLGVALVVGLAIGLLQALTSIQELTLTFVPKMVAMLVVSWISLSYLGQTLIVFFQHRVIAIAAGG